jgi:N-acetylmuramoyl-L-alanine amidase
MMPAAAPRLIIIDPGHGGNDPGKENKTLGLNEKTFTLDVALRLKKLLEAQGWRVLLTRSDDHELSPSKKTDLQMRDDLANKNKADLFLSIHFNSMERDVERVTGVETYALTPQFMFSSGEEKKGDMTDVAYPGNRLDYANLLLGEQLHRAMVTMLKTPDRGFKRARHAVLRMLDCPGALVECAYLSSNTEARRVATAEFRQQIASALATGLQNYALTLESLHPKPAAPPAVAPASPAAR